MNSNFRRRMALILLLILWLFPLTPAFAHKPSDSYLKFQGGGDKLILNWEIAIKDLELLVGLDADQDGQITWGELKSRESSIAAHALAHLEVTADERGCEFQLRQLMVNRHSDGTYAVLVLESDCPGDASNLQVKYSLLFDLDPTHRGLIFYRNGDIESTHVLGPNESTLALNTSERNVFRTLIQFVRVGVWHIWIGFDHILFLLSLLLPAVLVRNKGEWESVVEFRPTWQSVLKIVTVFTLAHSITLWLAVMEYVTLPAKWVEVTIAFSIVVTALNNLFPFFPRSGWIIAFVFGLIHGFGFANVLSDLGLSSLSMAISLLGFNVGVELGQLAIVLAFLPLAFVLRDSKFYRWIVFTGGSVLVTMIALVWMYERIFNVELLGF